MYPLTSNRCAIRLCQTALAMWLALPSFPIIHRMIRIQSDTIAMRLAMVSITNVLFTLKAAIGNLAILALSMMSYPMQCITICKAYRAFALLLAIEPAAIVACLRYFVFSYSYAMQAVM
uniref:Solute carrier family 35 member E3 n=1 Tax=Lygus hesperus TaxID=30085 RepID=A0A0A9X2V4_LYGHE